MSRFQHPMLDFIEGRYACFETSATTIYFSEAMADFLKSVSEAGLCPVIIAQADAKWTFIARCCLELAGAIRVIRFNDAFVNADSGVSGRSISAACEAGFTQWSRSSSREPELLFAVASVSAHHGASADLNIGLLTEMLAYEFGDNKLGAWGVHEPATLAWDSARYTDYVRSQMPDIRTVIVGGGGVFQATHSVKRTRSGVMEIITAIAPVATLDSSFAELSSRSSEILTRVAESTSMPLSGAISIMAGQRDAMSTAGTPTEAMPAAVLIGPRAVRAMDVDLEALALEHQISAVGRKKLPSLIASFDGSGSSPWSQAYQLAQAFGVSTLERAVGSVGVS